MTRVRVRDAYCFAECRLHLPETEMHREGDRGGTIACPRVRVWDRSWDDRDIPWTVSTLLRGIFRSLAPR